MDIVRPDLQRRRRRRRVLSVGGAVLCVVGIGIAAVGYGNASPSVPSKDLLIGIVRRGTFDREVRGPGKLVPRQMRWTTARTEASVERLLVKPGAAVSAGTPVLELSNPDVLDRFETARAAYLAADDDHRALESRLAADLLAMQSDAVAIQGELEAARVDEEAGRLGFEAGVLPAVEYRKRRIALEQIRQRAAIARQRVTQSQAAVRSQLVASQARLSELRNARELRKAEVDGLLIRAGMDGVVQELSVTEGERVTAGQKLARIAGSGPLNAELRIPESYSGDLQVGQSVTLLLGNIRVGGRVCRVDPTVENGAVLLDVEPTTSLPAGSRPEQSIDGIVTIQRIADTLFVDRPVNATGQASSSVFRLTGESEAESVPVRFGKESSNQIQVVTGLRAGDRIILSDLSRLGSPRHLTVD